MKIASSRYVQVDGEPVYDMTVSGTHNFALDAGVFVHNSKDVADAACGVASYLLTRRAAWTQQPVFIGEGGYMLHGKRTVHGGISLERKKKKKEEEESGSSKRRRVVRRKVKRSKRA